MDEHHVESEAELEAAHLAYECLQRIRRSAQAILPRKKSECLRGQSESFSSSGFVIHIRLDGFPQQYLSRYGQALSIEAHRMSAASQTSNSRGTRDQPISVGIRFDIEDFYALSVDERPLWKKDQPLPSGTHGGALQILHALSVALERRHTECLLRTIEQQQEAARQAAASLGALVTGLEE